MSNSRAIAAVTLTLKAILSANVGIDDTDGHLSGTTVTTLPLDLARKNYSGNQLNVFLYMVERNAAWMNADMPRQVKPGESAISPLPLTLFFLLTAFASDDDAVRPISHELLGKAMSILYDHPILSGEDIRTATMTALPSSDLDQQIEHVRISFHPLRLDDLSKLWTGFAMQYRLSAAYEVSVALIESTRPTRTPLPILSRGPNDRGIAAQSDLTPPLPTLYSITPPNQQPSAVLGDALTIAGVHLDGTNVGVRFKHPLWPDALEIAPLAGSTATSLTVQIPIAPADWPAGFYAVDVMVQRTGESYRRSTNQLTFSLAPKVALAPSSASASAGSIAYAATVSPEVRIDQRATLMLGDQEFLALPASFGPNVTQSGTLQFSAILAAGTYLVRLRVDGVDSPTIDRTLKPPQFNAPQVTVLA
jgi:hypothetical protein